MNNMEMIFEIANIGFDNRFIFQLFLTVLLIVLFYVIYKILIKI
jgi:hypothetical protein